MKIQKLLILSIDFDGVIHSYTSRWKGVDVIPDMPVPGAFEALTEKPPAWVTIDDRCVWFKGTFPKIDYLKKFQAME